MNMRPGVYTQFSITKERSPYKARSIGIIAPGNSAGVVKKISEFDEITSVFPLDSNGYLMAKMAMEYNYCDIFAIGVEGDAGIEDYKRACNSILARPEPYCIISDSSNADFALYVKEKLDVIVNSKLYFSGCTAASDAITLANTLNSERVCLTIPKLTLGENGLDYSPLLMAILVQNDKNSSVNFAGETFYTDFLVGEIMTEDDKNNSLYNGVSVFETVDGGISLIRAVTARTHDSEGNFDSTHRNICVILAADTIKSTIIDALSQRINASNPASSMGAVLSLVVSALVELCDSNVIAAYDTPTIWLDANDKSMCNISLNVTINQGINQIYLSINMLV